MKAGRAHVVVAHVLSAAVAIAASPLVPVGAVAAATSALQVAELDAFAAPMIEGALAADDVCFGGDTLACALHVLQAQGRRILGALPLSDVAPLPAAEAPALAPMPLRPAVPAPSPVLAQPAAPVETVVAAAGVEAGAALRSRLAGLPQLMQVAVGHALRHGREGQALVLALCSVLVLMMLGACLAVSSMRPKEAQDKAGSVRRVAAGTPGRGTPGWGDGYEDPPEGVGRLLPPLPPLPPATRQQARDRERRMQRKRGQDTCC